MSYTLVENDAQLAEALAALADGGDLAVDTEFMRRNTYHPQIALLQLCSKDHAWLIDPLGITALEPLRALLTDPARNKVLHSCSEDLEVFRHWLGVLPTPLIDTQRAAALLGEKFGLGYRALIEELVGIELEKGETRSDWLRRPLSDSQCHYAAQDVLQLVPAWEKLRQRALARDRMGWILEEGEEASRLLLERDVDHYRRVKSASRLDRRQLEALRELCEWREARARASDKPRGWVIDDKACIAIASALPSDVQALAALDVLPAAVLRKQADVLLGCVSRAQDLPQDSLPAALPGSLSAQQRQQLKELRGLCRARAEAMQVAPEILLSGADMELLLHEASGQPIRVPPRWDGWRGDAIVVQLRRHLAAAA